MSNFSTITNDDLKRYPALKGKQVGDVITGEERNALTPRYKKAVISEAPIEVPIEAPIDEPIEAPVEAPKAKKSKK